MKQKHLRLIILVVLLQTDTQKTKDCICLAYLYREKYTRLTMMVLLLPPRAFCRSLVRTESRYGTTNTQQILNTAQQVNNIKLRLLIKLQALKPAQSDVFLLTSILTSTVSELKSRNNLNSAFCLHWNLRNYR